MTHAETYPFDIDTIRQDFPILHQAHHDDIPLTFLDNAASSQKPLQVIEVVDTYYRTYHANVHRGIHKLSEAATAAYEEARRKVQRFINARSRREVIFTRGTTEGINLVASTWGRANLNEGDAIVLTVMEHHSNIVPWQMLAAERGFDIHYVDITPTGELDIEQYNALLQNEPVKLVAVMQVSNVLGTINPVKDMATAAHAAGAKILVDGAQSIPHMPVDVQALDCDFFVFSGHKMLGPTGIGILYGKRDLLEEMPPWQGGGDMIATVTLEGSTWNDLPYKFEAGTPSIAQAIGLGAAVDYLSALGMESVEQYEQQLATHLMERLAEVPGVRVLGPEASKRGAVASFVMDGIHAHDIAQLVDEKGVAVRAGHHCAMPLHQRCDVSATARASAYIYNTRDEIDRFIEALYYAKEAFQL